HSGAPALVGMSGRPGRGVELAAIIPMPVLERRADSVVPINSTERPHIPLGDTRWVRGPLRPGGRAQRGHRHPLSTRSLASGPQQSGLAIRSGLSPFARGRLVLRRLSTSVSARLTRERGSKSGGSIYSAAVAA